MLNDSYFMSKIRFYNAAFAFISFNAESDKLLSKNSVYTLRVSRNDSSSHHHAGQLTQNNDSFKKQCAQIYIMDGHQQEQ